MNAWFLKRKTANHGILRKNLLRSEYTQVTSPLLRLGGMRVICIQHLHICIQHLHIGIDNTIYL